MVYFLCVRGVFMEWYYIILIVIAMILILVLTTSFICYNITFNNKKRFKHTDDLNLPDLEPYRIFKEEIIDDIKEVKEYKHTKITIKSFDGLSLYGEYYEYKNKLKFLCKNWFCYLSH